MKKLILSGGIFTLLAASLALMSLTRPENKPHKSAAKPTTVNFAIYNTSGQSVSWTFRDSVEQVASGVNNGGTQYVPLPAEKYEVILNNAGHPVSFHMLFNTGEYYYAPGHTFFNINVSPSASTSLSLY